MDLSDLWKPALIVLFLVLSAFFSASETAFISLSQVRLAHWVNIGRPGATKVARMLQRPEKLLATVLLSNNLVNTALASVATALAISVFDNADMAVLLATVGVTLLLLVFGETLPKNLAWNRPEWVAFRATQPLSFIGFVLSPAVRLLQGLSMLVGYILGIKPNRSQVTEEEIRTMISMGASAGAVEASEAEMLEKVFHFGDRQVQEIMTPRTEIVWVEEDTILEQFLETYNQESHTRFPVFQGNIENIVGVLSVKDLVQSMARKEVQPGTSVTTVVRPAYFVPETKLVGALFSELTQQGQQMAIVIDQFGGVSGLVTLKRLMEVVVGPVGEEGEPAQGEIEVVGENIFEVGAGIGIQEANDELGLNLPEGNYQTLAGFILSRLGHIPEERECLHYRDLRMEVLEMRRLKIERVQIHRLVEQAVTEET